MSLSSLMNLFAQAAPAATPVPWYEESWFNAVVALLVLVLPFVFGHWYAKKIRMSDYGWRIGIIAFSLLAGIVVCVRGWPPKLGIDLSGGVILVYEVDQSKTTSVDLEGVAEELRKDLATDPAIAATVSVNNGKIEVQLPTADVAQAAKAETRLASSRLSDVAIALDSQRRRRQANADLQREADRFDRHGQNGFGD